MANGIYDDLAWRGLIAQSTDQEKLKEILTKPSTFYLGTDPTGASLHAGHLVQYLTARRLQQAGHKAIIVAGGATGKIGDPREVGERVLLSEETIGQWNSQLKSQILTLLDTGENGAEVVDNLAWISQLSAIDFLRDIGKHFSINVLIARDLIKRRLESDGISYTEFSYPLLQAYDYLYLHNNHGCNLQIGGSDQWGNIISGVELVRRVTGNTVHALTTPLVTDSEGRKIGKSTGGGGVWLDPKMTTPYAWYQYFFNISDADVPHYLKWFSFKPQEEIEDLITLSAKEPHKRHGQLALAEELTDLIHGRKHTQAVQQAAQALFGQGQLSDLDEVTLEAALEQASQVHIDPTQRHTIVDLLLATELVDSKSAARRTIREGGAYANNNKISAENWIPAESDWLHGHWLVLRRGKKNFAGVFRSAVNEISSQS